MQEIVDVLNREQFIDMLYQLVNTMSDLKQGKYFQLMELGDMEKLMYQKNLREDYLLLLMRIPTMINFMFFIIIVGNMIIMKNLLLR